MSLVSNLRYYPGQGNPRICPLSMIGYTAVRKPGIPFTFISNMLYAEVREQANRHRRPGPPYAPGQWVWLSTRDLRTPGLHAHMMISIAITLTDPLLDPVEGLGVEPLLASGAARREGALSQTQSQWPSQNTTGGHRHWSINS